MSNGGIQHPQYKWKPKELPCLKNACGLYLQMVTTADITDDGSGALTIPEYIVQGRRCPNRKSVWEWPLQERRTFSGSLAFVEDLHWQIFVCVPKDI
jgi:hypothetical protein